MLGPFATSRLTPIQQMSLPVLSRAACASMSTTPMTTTTRDRGDRYGPMEWAQIATDDDFKSNHLLTEHTQYNNSFISEIIKIYVLKDSKAK